MEDPSGEFSDGLDEFEESIDEKRRPPIKSNTAFKDKPYDEAYELSQDLSMAESFDGRDKVMRRAVACCCNDDELCDHCVRMLLATRRRCERKAPEKSYV